MAARALRPLVRRGLKPCTDRQDGQPEIDPNLKFCCQATNEITGITAKTAAFLDSYVNQV